MIPIAVAGAAYKTAPPLAAGVVALALTGGEITAIIVGSVTAISGALAKIAEAKTQISADELGRLRTAADENADLHRQLLRYQLGADRLVSQIQTEGLDPVWLPPEK